MDFYVFLIAFLGLSHISFGAKRIDVKERIKRNLNIIGRRHRRSIETSADDLLGLDKYEQLKPKETITTSHNTVKTKYVEEYKGLPVIGESIVLEQTADGQFTGDVSGSLLERIDEDVPTVIPLLSQEEAFIYATAVAGPGADKVSFRPDSVKLAIYTMHKNRGNENDEQQKVKAVLVYRVTITVTDPNWPREFLVTMDANTGKVLHISNQLESYGLKRQMRKEQMMRVNSMGGNEKIGAYVYGFDKDSLAVYTEDGITCKMQNEHVAVVHLNFSSDISALDKDTTQGFEFPCMKGVDDSNNGGYSPLSDAYAFFNNVYEMFEKWYQTKPLKHRAIIGVHCGKDLENAYYSFGQNAMCIGDGKDSLYPLVEVGVLAHEVCHGFTSDHSDLEYGGQSGGINEAFSDMASETSQVYLNKKSDWMIGFEIAKNTNGIFRYVDDPPKDNVSIASLKNYCPGMNVHYSSGVFNKAFYLLANRPGWDIRKAFHVFIVANTLYWKQDSDFADGACGAVKAAKDLGFNHEDVESVFLDIDVEPCVKRRYNFQNLIDTYVSSEKKFQKYFDVSGNSNDKVSIYVHIQEVFKDEDEDEIKNDIDEELSYNLTVKFNGRELITLTSNHTESVDLTDPKPGRYHITIEGKVPKVSVYVIANQLIHQEIETDEPNEYGIHGNVSFNLDPSESHPDYGVVIRAVGQHSMFYLFTRYGDKVDMHSMVFDNNGRSLDLLTHQTLYCVSRPGLYDVAVLSSDPEGNNNFTVTASRVFNLHPQTDV